jgi:16S rRNA (cytidine1402-2'-O)-methyltransferase
VGSLDGPFTFFEAPHRIEATLNEARHIFGKRPIVVGRELTKVHQEFLRGTTDQILAQLRQPRGEYTIVVGPRVDAVQALELPDDATVALEFGDIAKTSPGGRREAVATVARKYQKSTREVYAAIERAKSLVNARENS